VVPSTIRQNMAHSTFTLGQLRTNVLRQYFPEIKEMTALYPRLPDDVECWVERRDGVGEDGGVECDIVLEKGKPKIQKKEN
jgi:hypothetical protein